MKLKQNTIKFVIAIVILIVVIFITQLKKGNDPAFTNSNLTELPNIISTDILGKLFNTKDLRGKNVYIQFVNSSNPEDIDLIKTVYSVWREEDLEIVVITKDVNSFKSKMEITLEKMTLLSKDYEKLSEIFNLSSQEGTYYIFDKSSNIFAYGKNSDDYNKKIKTQLMRYIKNDFFSIFDFITDNKNISNIEWLNQIEKIVNKEDNKDYFIISMFTSICDTCSGSWLINTLKNFYQRSSETIFYSTILHDSFTKEDIDILKSQLKIDFSVIIADIELSQWWSTLIEKYNENEISNIALLVDKNGNILKILDNSCNCEKDFFNFVKSLII